MQKDMIWIVGAGGIAIEYAKVLQALGRDFIVIGRGAQSAARFEASTGIKPITGGLEAYILTKPAIPSYAINCVRVNDLKITNEILLDYGITKVLSEKPGVFAPEEVFPLVEKVKEKKANLFVAYNRRFYSSVIAAEKIIRDDGGLLSCNFEFTEWAHVFEKMSVPRSDLKYLFLGNSTHVVDLVFFLIGNPQQMSSYSNGTTGWHTPANFSGAGVSNNNILFSYNANWNAPGRWAVELLTEKHRIYLKPMEQLQLQDKGSVKVYPVEIDDHLDKEFKPGFYLQTKAFLEGDNLRLCTIEQQAEHISHIYKVILGEVK